MINLNEERYEKVSIFNNGVPGYTKGVASIKKRGKDEKATGPDYKIVITDDKGATIDYAIFVPKEFKSKDHKKVFTNSIMHIVEEVFCTKFSKENFDSIADFVEDAMKACNKSVTKNVSVFVCYGTKDKPDGFLRIESAWNMLNEKKGALTVKNEAKYNLIRVEKDKDPKFNESPKIGNDVVEDGDDW